MNPATLIPPGRNPKPLDARRFAIGIKSGLGAIDDDSIDVGRAGLGEPD
jgi:hypothetical protein